MAFLGPWQDQGWKLRPWLRLFLLLWATIIHEHPGEPEVTEINDLGTLAPGGHTPATRILPHLQGGLSVVCPSCSLHSYWARLSRSLPEEVSQEWGLRALPQGRDHVKVYLGPQGSECRP